MAANLESITLPLLKVDKTLGARKQRITVNTAGNLVPVFSGRCLLVGMLLRAGAVTTTAIAYDMAWQGSVQPGALTVDTTKEAAGVKAAVFDGFVNFPIICNDGLVVSLDQIDGVLNIFFVPL